MGDTRKLVVVATVIGVAVFALILLLLRGFGGERDTELPAPGETETAHRANVDRPVLPDLPKANGKARPTPEQRAARKNKKSRRHVVNPDANPDIPKRPPLLLDAEMRASYKEWWLAETERRSRIYLRKKPGKNNADADELAGYLDEFYDASEARQPGETDEQYIARQTRHHELLTVFMDEFGTSLHAMLSYGGDSQFGRTPVPPVAVDEDDGR